MPTHSTDLDAMRASILDRVERHARNFRLALFGAATVEALLIAVAIVKLDFSNRFEVIVFILFISSYSIVGLGLVALGAHVSRIGDRVLAALDGLRHA